MPSNTVEIMVDVATPDASNALFRASLTIISWLIGIRAIRAFTEIEGIQAPEVMKGRALSEAWGERKPAAARPAAERTGATASA